MLPAQVSNVEGFSNDTLVPANEGNRESVRHLEATMQDMPTTKDEQVVTHHFAPHVYGREIRMPAGHVVVGKIHKHSHLNILSQGKVLVATEEGTEELVAPCTFTSLAGIKRAVLILEDTIWTTIHVTEETDLVKIEDEVIAKDYEALDKETRGVLI
jgi:hypothetical protein